MPRLGLVASRLDDLYQAIVRWRANPSEVWGLPTGLRALDELTGGLHPGELSVLAGRPGIGKSALGFQIAWNLAENLEAYGLDDHYVVAFSAEMAYEQVVLREIARRVRIPANQIRKGLITERDEQKIQEVISHMRALPLVLDDTHGIAVDDLVRHIEDYNEQYGNPALILIDHIGKLAITEQNRYWAFSAISNKLARLPRRYRCPVIVISQLNREVERRDDRIPTISDLRETGVLEQDADNIYLLYRESYYRATAGLGADEEGDALIIVGKSREGGVGSVRVVFDPVYTEYRDRFAEYQ